VKAIPARPSVTKADASLDAKPRQGTTLSVAATITSSSTNTLNPIWRTDATIGSVLGARGRMATAPSGD
jgi:hypothetical protein